MINPRLLFAIFLLPNRSCFVSRHRNNKIDDNLFPETSQKYHQPADSCSERSYLWRIDSYPPSYFFGTIHVPYTKVWSQMPDNVKTALKDSENVYLELDPRNPVTVSLLADCQLLPNGTTLSQVIPTDVFTRLKSHLAWVKEQIRSWMTEEQLAMGLTPDSLFKALTANWEIKRPVWLMFLVQSLTPIEIASIGLPILDIHIAQIAEEQNKEVGDIETVLDQCLPMNDLPLKQSIFALNQTIEYVKKYGNIAAKEQLVNSYQCGNLSSETFVTDTENLSVEDKRIATEIDLYFRKNMLYRRNQNMGNRVVELLSKNPGASYFFAFGAMHFVGENTILDVVRKAGFNVEQVQSRNTLDFELWNLKQIRPTVLRTDDDLFLKNIQNAFSDFGKKVNKMRQSMIPPTTINTQHKKVDASFFQDSYEISQGFKHSSYFGHFVVLMFQFVVKTCI